MIENRSVDLSICIVLTVIFAGLTSRIRSQLVQFSFHPERTEKFEANS